MNQHVSDRLKALHLNLLAHHQATGQSASAVKGAARADFIDGFLREALPPSLRICSRGQITDTEGRITGELDIVLENGFFPSFPLQQSESGRLHLAEGVGVVLEVKSNLSGQLPEALSTAAKVKALSRTLTGTFGTQGAGFTVVLPMTFTDPNLPKAKPTATDSLREKIPFFIVGYRGWQTDDPEALRQRVAEHEGLIDGILQIEPLVFAAGSAFQGMRAKGDAALFAFIASLHRAFAYVQHADADLRYYVG